MSALSLRKKSELDMTEGSILPLIISFSIPLLMGNLFQQLYNTVDTWVVGNYVGKNSFSAVGTLSSVLNMVISFFVGFSSGASVVISQYYGAKDSENVSRATHTFVALTIIMCVLCTFGGLAFIPAVIKLLKSPAEVASEQVIYMSIYFAGISGLLIYNMGSAILRAIGNSTDPFIFLVVSAVLNIILDLVFVIAFKMGTAGVAYATILSQFISAILCLFVLFRTKTAVKLHIKQIKLHKDILSKIVKIGLPSALQIAITCFSNIFIQSFINQFGSDVMGGWTAYIKVDQFLILPTQSISIAVQTFVGQNIGVMNIERAKQGVKISNRVSMIFCAILAMPVMLLAGPIVKLFIGANEPQVVYYGRLILLWITPWHVITVYNQIYAGALRGAGKSSIPMAAMLFSFVLFRQLYEIVISKYVNHVIPVAFGYPAGWILCSILLAFGYKHYFTEETLNRV